MSITRSGIPDRFFIWYMESVKQNPRTLNIRNRELILLHSINKSIVLVAGEVKKTSGGFLIGGHVISCGAGITIYKHVTSDVRSVRKAYCRFPLASLGGNYALNRVKRKA